MMTSEIRSGRALHRIVIAVMLLVLIAPAAAHAQRGGFARDRIEPVTKQVVPFRALSAADFGKVAAGDMSGKVRVPTTKKTMTVAQYLEQLNAIERRLNAGGLSMRTIKGDTKLARLRTTKDAVIVPAGVQGAKLTAAQRSARFTAVELPIPGTAMKSVSLGTLNAQQVKTLARTVPKKITGPLARLKAGTALKDSPLKDAPLKGVAPRVPGPEFVNRSYTPQPMSAGIAGYTGKVILSHTQKATAQPIDGDNASMDAVKATDSEFSMGVGVRVQMKLPKELSVEAPVVGKIALGDGFLDIYHLQADYKVQSNASKPMSARSRVKVVDQLIIDDDKPNITGDRHTFAQQRNVPLIRQKLGGFDMYSWFLDQMVPIDVYWGIEAGGAFDVRMDRASIQAEAAPRLTQSLTIEWGLAPDMFENIVDAGVGGKFDLVALNVGVGGVVGLHFGGGSVILKDEAYMDAEVQLMRGRLYTFYKYPAFICDNIFSLQALDPNCYAIRRVEEDIVDTGALINLNTVLLSDDGSRALAW